MIFFVFATHLHGRMTEIVWTHDGICLDAQGNLHGRTTELAWTHKGICMDKQRNLLGHINFSFWGKKVIDVYYFIPFVLLRPKFNGYTRS